MWILYAFGSAFFAGITAILAKIGIKNTDSNLATAIRTIGLIGIVFGTLLLVV
jgi:transporter family protein